MSFKVTNTDYSKILTYYNIRIPKNKQELKKTAEDILAMKLCSCIKKIGGPKNEARAIGICTKTVMNRKGLTRGKFKCKNGRKLSFTKKRKVLSIGKNVSMKNKRKI